MVNFEKNVLITVLNYKGWQDTLVCVESILNQTYTDYHILIIDNGSGDESISKLSHLGDHPNITFHKEPENLGFAGGVNVGIKKAIEENYTLVALLNNDASLSSEWLEKLVQTHESHDISAAGGLLLYRDESTIDSTGDCMSIWGLPFGRNRDENISVAPSEGYVFNSTAGACLYKTSLFKDIGLFDERFFAYFEDTDIGFRAQLAGHKAYYQPAAVAYHEHGSTSGKMPGFTVKQTFQNLPMLVIKNTPPFIMPAMWSRFFVIYWLLFIRAVLRGQAKYAFRGLLGSIKRLNHAFDERRRIQRSKIVSDQYLRSIIYPGLPPENKRTLRKMAGLK